MAQHGDPVPIEEALAQAGWLRSLAASLVADPAAADDVAQETWVAALRHSPPGGERLRPWLARVARNVARDFRRGAGRRTAREQHASDERPNPSPERIAEEAEAQRLVAEAVAALEEPFRTTVVLRYFRGHDAVEIGRKLGVPAGTVRWRLKKALERLRAALDRASGGERERWLQALAPFAVAPPDGIPAGSIPLGPLTLGGLLALKKVVLAVVVLVLGGLAWMQLPPRESIAVAEVATAEPTDLHDRVLPATRPHAERRTRAPFDGDGTAAPPFGTLLVHARWNDGTPAAEIGLILHPGDDPLGGRHVVQVATDANGTARVERFRPGTVRIEGDRGGALEAFVEAGEETEVTFDLPPGVDIAGAVSGPDGPVAGAEILLVSIPQDSHRARARDWLSTRVVARTSREGTFSARSVGEHFALSARARDYLPAYLQEVAADSPPGEPQWFEFVLGLSSLGVQGVVLDSELRPAGGAAVAVGDSYSTIISQENGELDESFALSVVRTAEDGTFFARGARQALRLEASVAVMAEGFPIWSGTVAGALGGDSYLQVVLDPAATIEGFVRDSEGNGVAGARVCVQDLAGRRGLDIPFPLPRETSGADGHYRLELVTPGDVAIEVEPPDDSGLGPGFARVLVHPGETTKQDVVLPGDDVIRGRAEDYLGRPLVDHTIRWRSTPLPLSQEPVRTGPDGRFEIAGADQPPYRLELMESGQWKAATGLEDVVPGPEEVVLVLPHMGSVSGVFVDDGTRANDAQPGTHSPMRRRPALSIFLSARRGDGRSAEIDEGRFTFSRVPPGTYRLTIRTPQSLIHRSEWFELHPGEHRDLGTIRSEPAGSLVVVFPPGSEPASLQALLRTPDFVVAGFLNPGEQGLGAEGISPGTWYVDIHAEGLSGFCKAVEVRSGETTRLAVRLEPGTDRTLAFELPDQADWNELHVSVGDGSGRLFLAQRIEQEHTASPSVLVTLPRGTFVVDARTDTGLEVSGTVTVPDLGLQDAPLVFTLH